MSEQTAESQRQRARDFDCASKTERRQDKTANTDIEERQYTDDRDNIDKADLTERTDKTRESKQTWQKDRQDRADKIDKNRQDTR